MKKIKSILLLLLLGPLALGLAAAAPGHGWHGGWHGGGGWHGHSSIGVTIGGPLFWSPYPYYPGPYYAPAPVVVVPPAPQTYIEQSQDAGDPYWYFCSDPRGYYPYVKACPSGWHQVAPQPSDAD